MSTITGGSAVKGSQVRVLIVSGTNEQSRSIESEQLVSVDAVGNWAANVTGPTAAGTYVEVQVPHANGPDTYSAFSLADDEGGTVAALVAAHPVTVTARTADLAPLFAVLALVSAGAADTMPKESIPILGANSEGAVGDGPWTIAATTGVAGVTLTAPAFGAGTLVANKIELSVSDAAGTQKLVLDVIGTPIALTTGQVLAVDFTSATVVKATGADLVWDGTSKQIKSTAGGEFLVDALVILTPTNLAA
jgi:hypothetical protein